MMVRMRVDFHVQFRVEHWEELGSNRSTYLEYVFFRFGDLCEVLKSVHLLLKATRKYRSLILTKRDLCVKLTMT